MSWRDRDYADDSPRPTMRFGANLTPVVKLLLIANVAVAVLRSAMAAGHHRDFLYLYGSLAWGATVGHLQIWRLLTYQYLHSGLMHLLFNMLVLWFMGPMIERPLGRRTFFAFYTFSGFLAGVVFLLVGPVLTRGVGLGPGSGSLIGASGSILGILAGAAILFPNTTILVFFALPMRMRTFAVGMAAIYLVTIISSGDLSDLAHLGGMGGGAAWILIGRRWEGRRIERSAGRWDRQQQALAREQAKVDRILAKVHERGIGSLTWLEKRVLRQATRRQREQDRQRERRARGEGFRAR